MELCCEIIEFFDQCGFDQRLDPTLHVLLGYLRLRIFHMNLQICVNSENAPAYPHLDNTFPYDNTSYTPFSEGAMNDTLLFASLLIRVMREIKGYEEFGIDLIENHIKKYMTEHSATSHTMAAPEKVWNYTEILKNPVIAYKEFMERRMLHNNHAPFPEFKEQVDSVLQELRSQRVRKNSDRVIRVYAMCVEQLLEESADGGYKYRSTLFALLAATMVFELIERSSHGKTTDWYECEESWYLPDRQKMLLPLYHTERYSYQEDMLMDNPEVILFPFHGDATMEDLIQLRPVPIYIVGIVFETIRADRHHNSPLDFWYHDINHGRRMWGYDQLHIKHLNLKTSDDIFCDMQKRCDFLDRLLKETCPTGVTDIDAIRSLVRFLIFETMHETALVATSYALLNDLLRKPGTRQPFEVQRRTVVHDKEELRTFDGNLCSGASFMGLCLNKRVTVEFFWDRAPCFLANVHNKLFWGFFGSVFEERSDPDILKYRTTENLASAAIHLFNLLEYPDIPTHAEMVELCLDRSGQPELYNYFALRIEDDQTDAIRAGIADNKAGQM